MFPLKKNPGAAYVDLSEEEEMEGKDDDEEEEEDPEPPAIKGKKAWYELDEEEDDGEVASGAGEYEDTQPIDDWE